MIFQSIKYLCLRIVPSTTVFSGCLWTLTIYWFSQISTITERSFPYKQWNLHILKLNYFRSSNKSIQMQQKKSLNQYQRFCDSHKIEKYKSLYIFYNFFFSWTNILGVNFFVPICCIHTIYPVFSPWSKFHVFGHLIYTFTSQNIQYAEVISGIVCYN